MNMIHNVAAVWSTILIVAFSVVLYRDSKGL